MSTVLAIHEGHVEVVYQGTEFDLDRELIEEATGKQYPDVTDHEILQIVESDPDLEGEPRRVGDVL